MSLFNFIFAVLIEDIKSFLIVPHSFINVVIVLLGAISALFYSSCQYSVS